MLSPTVKWGASDRVVSDIRKLLHHPPHPEHVWRSGAPQSRRGLWPSHSRRWPCQGLGSHRAEPASGICLGHPTAGVGQVRVWVLTVKSQPQGSAWGLGVWPQPSPWADSAPPPAWELRVAWRTRAGQPAPTRLCSSCRLLLADGPSKPSEPRLEPEKQGGSQSLPAQACALPHPAGSF